MDFNNNNGRTSINDSKNIGTHFDEKQPELNLRYNGGDRYLKGQIEMLKWIFVWPLDTENIVKIIFYRIVSVVMLLLLLVSSFGQIMQIIYGKNLGNVTSAIDIVTLTSTSFYKMAFIMVYSHRYKALLYTIGDKFLERPIVDRDNIDSGIYRGDFKRSINMKYWCRYAYTFAFSYIVSTFWTMTIWGFTPLIEDFVFSENDVKDFFVNRTDTNSSRIANKNYNHLLPLNAWVPFDVSWSPMFEFVFVLEMVPLVESGLIYIVEDGFFFTLLWYLGGQFELLKESLNNIDYKMKIDLADGKGRTIMSG